MLEIRDGVECFKLKEYQILITPDLTRIKIPLDMEFPPSDLKKLEEKDLKRFRKWGIIVDSKINDKKPKYIEKRLLNRITFKNLDNDKIEFIFTEFLKNCSMAPYITIDCSFDTTSKLLDLINQKYNENSINPILVRLDYLNNCMTMLFSIVLNIFLRRKKVPDNFKDFS